MKDYKNCKSRIEEEYKGRLTQLKEGKLEGLGFDYVPPDTFGNQPIGYFRWQLSWGGPSDEFRVYDNENTIKYYFLDWFDGASIYIDDDEVVEVMARFMEGHAENNRPYYSDWGGAH